LASAEPPGFFQPLRGAAIILNKNEKIPHGAILESLLDTIKVGILVMNSDGIIVFYNKECSRIDGLEIEDVLGRNLIDVYPSLTTETSILYQVMRAGQPIYNATQHYTNFRGMLTSIVNSTIPIRDRGKIWGAMEISQDVNLAWESYETILDLQAMVSPMGRKIKKPTNTPTGFNAIVTRDRSMKKIITLGRQTAKMDCPLVVYGETGTGKELFIQAIHHESSRKDQPLITQNCAALPETLLEAALFGTNSGAFTGAQNRPGLFELADKGILFLDEVMSAPISLQAKLLRVLEDMTIRRVGGTGQKKVDVRVVASLNMHPEEAIKSGLLREDFFYRLSYMFIELIPLRKRKNDIPLLAKYFLEQHAEATGNRKEITAEALQVLAGHNWPGNVRELKNIIDKVASIAESPVIGVDHLALLKESSYIGLKYPWDKGAASAGEVHENGSEASLQEIMDSYEREIIVGTLKRCGGNLSAAAKALDTPRQTLWSKTKKLGIKT
jgi:arginine utilization regulatory protein